jgi:hypothetical protein
MFYPMDSPTLVVQVLYPEVQRRAVQAAHKHALRMNAVRSFAYFCQRWGGMLNNSNDNGSPRAAGSDTSGASEQALKAVLRPEVIMRLFQRFDLDGNGSIDESELRAMIVGLEIARPDVRNQYGGLEEHVALWMREFDKDKNGVISVEEFQQGKGQDVSMTAVVNSSGGQHSDLIRERGPGGCVWGCGMDICTA